MESNKSYRKVARLAQPGQWKKHGWILARARVSSILQDIQTSSGVHPASSSVNSRVLSPGVMHTTHLHLMLRLRMRGAIPPFSPYAFMGCTREGSNLTVIT